MAVSKMVLCLLLFTCLLANASATRTSTFLQGKLEQRLQTSVGLVDCWNAVMELKSCTVEIVEFLTIGQAQLGPDCCRGISIITHNCWPSMLNSLGFTVEEEGLVLLGYCDRAAAPAVAPPPATLE